MLSLLNKAYLSYNSDFKKNDARLADKSNIKRATFFFLEWKWVALPGGKLKDF